MQNRSIELSETIDTALVTFVSKNLNQSLNLLPNCLFFAQNCLYLTMCILLIVGRKVRFKSDALRQGVYRLKQRKIDTRQKLCLDGLGSNVAERLEQHGQNGERPCSG